MIGLVFHRMLTGVLALVAVLAMATAWITQNRLAEAKTSLHDHDVQIAAITGALKAQAKLDASLVSSQNTVLNALQPHHKKSVTRTLAASVP